MLIRPCFCLENVPKAEPKSKHRKLPYSVGFGMPHSPGPTGVGRASKERRSPPARQQTQTPTCCGAAARKGEIKVLRRAIIKNLGDRASFPLRRLVPRVLSPAPYQVSRPAARPLGSLERVRACLVRERVGLEGAQSASLWGRQAVFTGQLPQFSKHFYPKRAIR